MINEVILGITNKIRLNFENHEIYINEIKQGFKEPCFFINILNVSIKRIHKTRKFKQYDFMIQFFQEKKQEIQTTSDILEEILEYIEVGEDKALFMGKNMNSTIVDGVLNFKVTYSGYLHIISKTFKMDKIKNNIGVKEE